MKLVATVYGDDQSDKSYREAIGLLRSNPNLKAIIAPTTVGINAASKAVVDENLVGKVFVTGLGLPSEMAGHVKSGAVREFAIWNPIDLGYAATYAAHQFVTGKATSGKPGASVSVGRMGSVTLDANGEARAGAAVHLQQRQRRQVLQDVLTRLRTAGAGRARRPHLIYDTACQ